MSILCPCGSTQSYCECCEPFHLGHTLPATAEQLMRSRYAAFVLDLTDYIVATTVPFEQALLDKPAIQTWAVQTRWDGLEIIGHLPKLGKRHAQVEFKAYFLADGSRHAHHERSSFVKIRDHRTLAERWYFLDPTVAFNVSQKQPCPCGSGEKYKRCCGQFLG